MRPRKLIACAVLVMSVSACAGQSPPHAPSASPQSGPHTTSPSSGTHSTSPSTEPCPFTSDSVNPMSTPLVLFQPPSATSQAITAFAAMTCDTTVTVVQPASAQLKFGATATCTLRPETNPVVTAKLISRYPMGFLFQLNPGHIVCNFTSETQAVELCGEGAVQANPPPAGGSAACNPDPIDQIPAFFQVAAYSGTLLVTVPGGQQYTLAPGQELTYDFVAGKPVFGPAVFSRQDYVDFKLLSRGSAGPA